MRCRALELLTDLEQDDRIIVPNAPQRMRSAMAQQYFEDGEYSRAARILSALASPSAEETFLLYHAELMVVDAVPSDLTCRAEMGE